MRVCGQECVGGVRDESESTECVCVWRFVCILRGGMSESVWVCVCGCVSQRLCVCVDPCARFWCGAMSERVRLCGSVGAA